MTKVDRWAHALFPTVAVLLSVLFLLRFSAVSPWEGVLILLGGTFFARRYPLLAASAAAFIPAVSPPVRVLLAAMLLYSLLFPLVKRIFGASPHPPAAVCALLASLSAFWLPFPTVLFSSGLFYLSLAEGRRPFPTADGMICAILAGVSFLLALPLYYL